VRLALGVECSGSCPVVIERISEIPEEYIVHLLSIKLIMLDEIVSCGCRTWSVTFGEEHGQRVFETRVLREVFGTKMEEVTGEWRKLTNVELKYLFSQNTVKPQFYVPMFCI
jgi:hypothetical protein